MTSTTPKTSLTAAEIAQLDERLRGESLWMSAWKRLIRNRLAIIGLVVIGLNIVMALFAPQIAPREYQKQILTDKNAAPEWVTSTISATAESTPAGTTSQPRRQPVMIQVLEKLLQTMTRSSGAAMSRRDGAAAAPS